MENYNLSQKLFCLLRSSKNVNNKKNYDNIYITILTYCIWLYLLRIICTKKLHT